MWYRTPSIRRLLLVPKAMLLAACSHMEPLSNAYSPFGRDLPLRPPGIQVSDTPVAIRIADLVAESERYHQRQIRTHGYMTLRFEGNTLCAGTNRSESTCLWLDIDGLQDPGFRTGRALVEGTFNGENLGHLGAASGAIERITALRRLQ